MRIQIASTAFAEGHPIPDQHAFENENLSPDLQWSGVPSSAKCLVLICDDPDAPNGAWVHWLLYDLIPSMTGLPEGLPKTPLLDLGAKQGLNDYGRFGWGGPFPPPGNQHRYLFKLYALDLKPDWEAGLKKNDLLKAMDGHVLAEGQLMGTYQRE